MRAKKKRFLGILLSLALVIGIIPGMTTTALAAENSTDYTITIPATLSVANAGWNATDGITAQVKSGDTFDTGKKLTVTATSTNNWALKSGDNSVGYNLATASGTYSASAAPASWEFSADELNAESGTNKPMGINVQDYTQMSIPAGEYKDTVTFTAKVEKAKQLHSITLTGPYSGHKLEMEFYEGDTWNDMAAKYSEISIIRDTWIGYHTDGMINKNGSWVTKNEPIDPNATYTVE